MADHADQSRALMGDATPLEGEILGACALQNNHAVLHCEASLMPKRRGAWAAWNYVSEGPLSPAGGNEASPKSAASDLCLTYWMNRLQSIDLASRHSTIRR